MSSISTDLLAHVFARLREVQRTLGIEPVATDDPNLLLTNLLDSMGLVELVAVLAGDRGVTAEAIEKAAGHRFESVASLAAAVDGASRNEPRASARGAAQHPSLTLGARSEQPQATCRLTAPCVHLPARIEEADELDVRLGRPPGWLEAHSGIRRRYVWENEDAVEAAAGVGRTSLEAAGLLVEEVGGLLVTSQAPPLLAGLAAAIHQRLDLPPRTVALEVGGACTGFLQALWLARSLIERLENILIIAVEAPSRHLHTEPGEAGEAAALFGDGTAACLATSSPEGPGALPVVDVDLSVSEGRDLLGVAGDGRDSVHVRMDGPRLASRAVEALTELVRETAQRHKLSVEELSAVIVHGGNGRMPGLVARRLGLPAERVWSQTGETGNLGSASLPLAWARGAAINGPVAWAAVGAGLTLASALTLAPVTSATRVP